MRVWGKLGQFLGLPSQPKRDRDGIREDLSYLSNETPDDEEEDTVSHQAIGNLEHVYFTILGPFAAFLQGVESD